MAHQNKPIRYPVFHMLTKIKANRFDQFAAEITAFDNTIGVMLIAQECEQSKGNVESMVMLLSLMTLSNSVVQFFARLEKQGYISDTVRIDSESLFDILCDIGQSF